ncbi:unnamed protein product [Ectocarpus sp. 12 AP-2014]
MASSSASVGPSRIDADEKLEVRRDQILACPTVFLRSTAATQKQHVAARNRERHASKTTERTLSQNRRPLVPSPPSTPRPSETAALFPVPRNLGIRSPVVALAVYKQISLPGWSDAASHSSVTVRRKINPALLCRLHVPEPHKERSSVVLRHA